jgi:hypothetical protein
MRTDAGLPYEGSTPLTRHTSNQGAEAAEPKALPQMVRYIVALTDAPDGLTDHEAERRLSIPLASVIARRDVLRRADLVYPEGTRPGPTGEPNAVWRWRDRSARS